MCGFFACEEPAAVTFTVTLGVNDSTMGTVTGAGTYESGKTVTITAIANTGYKFVRWSDEVTTNPRELIVSQDTTLTAIFEELLATSTGTHNGYDYVDLGLPSGTLWATSNIGAISPEDYGDYFAWGETTTKERYRWDTYKYCNGGHAALTKYCTSIIYGYNRFKDGKTVLEPSDDAAIVHWGGDWRMPTEAEQAELNTECTWRWATTPNGVNGYKVKGKNGNILFLPAAGSQSYWGFSGAGSQGHYWSSSLNEPGSNADVIYFDSIYFHGYSNNERYRGQTIRPVYLPR